MRVLFGPLAAFWPRAGSSAKTNVDLEMQEPLADVEDHPTQRLCNAIFGSDTCQLSQWPGLLTYEKYLEASAAAIGPVWIEPAITYVAKLERPLVLRDYLEFVVVIAEIIQQQASDSPSIHQISETWLRQGYGKEMSQFDKKGQDNCRRAVFCVLTWIFLLVDASPSPKTDAFEVVYPGGLMNSPASQGIEATARRPICSLLRGFCQSHLSPTLHARHPYSRQDPVEDSISSDLISVSCVNYAMLRGFGNVTIEWTNTITHHLLFVPTTRKLYLFRLPTICAVGCLSDEGKSPILDQVMRDYFEPLETATNIWPRFKQEIILSYRILFGQDKASRKLYLKDVKPTLGDNSDPLMDILSTKTTGSAQIQNLPGELWPRACRNREDKLRKQGEYSISDDLPMLGPRLLVLQELNQRQRPRTLWTFWRDTRDKPKWYTFWLVLIAGAIAIVLSLAQLGVSVAQLVATPS